ncbi:hypothetical protein ACFVU2_17840 [Leifsonia sp. NPDC058194]|uniref:hypothetical protein n=1 Tax=Leifsonia sp. NPDC058194 TaxID=3346374 RepID=UPI0036D8A294
MFDDADAAIARVEADIRLAQERAERLPSLVSAAAAIRGTATSRRRDLAVEVDQSGGLVDLRITDAALDLGSARLSSELLALIAEAKADAQRQILAAATELLGEDDPAVATLRAATAAAAEPADGSEHAQ